MSIHIEQTARTEFSVTIKISGITDDRRTYIWIPWRYKNSSYYNWWTLHEALNNKDIVAFTTSGGDNGYIYIAFHPKRVDETFAPANPDYVTNLKVWQFLVANVIGGNDSEFSGVLSCVLEFNWDMSSKKAKGNPVDITKNDFVKLNWFALYINDWIGGVENSWSFYNDSIHAVDLVSIVEKLLNARQIVIADFTIDPLEEAIKLSQIVADAKPGTPCKASYFNDVKDMINKFNLEV